MTNSIQPGEKQRSASGRLAVNFYRRTFQAGSAPGCGEGRSTVFRDLHDVIARIPIRLCLGAAFVLLFAVPPAGSQTRLAPVPDQQPVRPQPRMIQPPARPEEHLQRWMESHSGMSLAQQQHALQSEPGFRELPPQIQQNRLNTLARLYNMNPRQRTRILDRAEALERLAPPQRQQWRDAVQRLNMLPPPRKHVMAGAIIELRELPPEQRDAVLASPAYQSQFSPYERQTLRTLLMAEPYPPVRAARPSYPPPPVP
jgi:hypothetical protein